MSWQQRRKLYAVHNSAPHATKSKTLRPRLNRSSQRGEHICMKIPAFFAPLRLQAPTVVKFLLRCSFLEIDECNISQP